METIKPFIKWAGGKEKELAYIKENLHLFAKNTIA